MPARSRALIRPSLAWLTVVAALCSLSCEAGQTSAPTKPATDPFHLLPAASSRAPLPFKKASSFGIEPQPIPESTPGPLMSIPPSAEEPAPAGAELPHVEDPPPTTDTSCPKGMVLIHGDYCTNPRQDCLHWLDPDAPPFGQKRCAQFAPSKCIGDRKHLRLCIDKEEMTDGKSDLPTGDLSWTLSKEHCGAQGKRLCTEEEWTFACEGEDMLPYPTGLTREGAACNFDRNDLLDSHGKMADHRAPASEFPKCASPFGVLEMVGNVDEWVWREKAWTPWRAGLKGGWWLAGRNRCRPETTGHDEYYHDLQTGVRCCKDAAK